MSIREDARLSANRFSERLKAARKRARLTQEALGDLSEVSPVTLSKLETGVNAPTLEVLITLAKALDVSPNYFTGWLDDQDATRSEHRALLSRFQLVASNISPQVLEKFVTLAEAVSSEKTSKSPADR